MKTSKELYKEAVKVMPGGVNSPVRAFKAVGDHPIFIQAARGAYITDVEGKSYIDFCMSWGPLILGHAPKAVIDKLYIAAGRGVSFGTCHPAEIDLAKTVCQQIESIDSIRFVNSGTEAVMSALRVARGVTQRNLIVKFDGCYHGHVDSLLVAAGSGLATLGQPDSAGVTPAQASETLILPLNDISSLKKLMQEKGHEIAAIIIEGMPCNLGMIPLDKRFVHALRELTREFGSLLIFDEVITGFRLPSGAEKLYDVQPDLSTLGKVLGGGMPLGAFGGKAEYMHQLAPLGPVYQAGTLSGNPVAVATGLATIQQLVENDAWQVLEQKGKALDALVQQHELISKGYGYLRQGSIFWLVPIKNTCKAWPPKNAEDVRQAVDTQRFANIHQALLDQGIYLPPSAYEVTFLSLAHDTSHLERLVQSLAKVSP